MLGVELRQANAAGDDRKPIQGLHEVRQRWSPAVDLGAFTLVVAGDHVAEPSDGQLFGQGLPAEGLLGAWIPHRQKELVVREAQLPAHLGGELVELFGDRDAVVQQAVAGRERGAIHHGAKGGVALALASKALGAAPEESVEQEAPELPCTVKATDRRQPVDVLHRLVWGGIHCLEIPRWIGRPGRIP